MGGRRQTLRMKQTSDLIEVSCKSMPQKLCEFQPMKGKILKTVDSVYQDVEDLDQCKERCLSENFECNSYDFMSAGTKICRLSHHSSASLSHIQEPYIAVDNTTTYELRGCYQINVECRAKSMTAKIHTSSLFDGKVYVKSRPNTCVYDAENSTSIDFTLPYNDVQCDVLQEGEGLFSANIVVQNHDMIVTSADVGLALHCKYDLQNATVTNSLLSGLEVKAGIATEYIKETIVASPNVTMRITTRDGEEIPSAQVGDELALMFEIVDKDSPYGLFVRELVAMDGQDSSEIYLIDEHGCPTDTSIMGAVNQLENGKSLRTLFQAFKFPASDVVQFRALVTPCLPKCEPTICSDFNVDGLTKESYGRRKRSIDDQSLLVARSVRITDNFSFKDLKLTDAVEKEVVELEDTCVSFVSVIICAILFLVSQVVILMVWSYLWHKKRATKQIPPVTGNLPEELIYGTLSSRHTSTSRMTD
ncbi:hypothetical protein Avbf_05420 [Armadillidium vulgare]|nr:hypothetical protein Avbf_05420 [Armadillidium vulgare]